MQERFAEKRARLRYIANWVLNRVRSKYKLVQSLEFEQSTPFGIEFPKGLAELIKVEDKNPLDFARNAIMFGQFMELGLVVQEQPDGKRPTIRLKDIEPVLNNRYKRTPQEDIRIDEHTAFSMGDSLEARQEWFERALSFFRRYEYMSVFLVTSEGHQPLTLALANREFTKRKHEPLVIRSSDASHIVSPIPPGMKQVT